MLFHRCYPLLGLFDPFSYSFMSLQRHFCHFQQIRLRRDCPSDRGKHNSLAVLRVLLSILRQGDLYHGCVHLWTFDHLTIDIRKIQLARISNNADFGLYHFGLCFCIAHYSFHANEWIGSVYKARIFGKFAYYGGPLPTWGLFVCCTNS